MGTLRAQINPLRCLPIDLPQVTKDAPSPDAARLFEYLFDPDAEQSVEAFVRRYREVEPVAAAFPFAPAEPAILGKLMWPLRHALGGYCLADYLGCIALCGMVGEMVAILLWEISPYPRGTPQLGDAQARRLFGSTFEKLGQERRVDVLRGFRLIDEPTGTAFDDLRTIRRRYLHLFSQPHDSLEADARRALDDAAKVVAFALGLTLKDGTVGLRQDLMAYLDARGWDGATD